jgi:hypothetical protein
MRDYDEWKLASGQEEKVFCYCDECNEPIYVGDNYIRLGFDGACLCSETNCFEYYVEKLIEPKYKEAL